VTRFIEIARAERRARERETELWKKAGPRESKGDPREGEDRRNYVCRGNLASHIYGTSEERSQGGAVKVKVTRFSRPLVAKGWISYEEASPEEDLSRPWNFDSLIPRARISVK